MAIDIKGRYGKSYTNCTTAQLQEFIESATTPAESVRCSATEAVEDALATLAEALYAEDVISSSVFHEVLNKIGVKQVNTMSQEDINEMFDFVK